MKYGAALLEDLWDLPRLYNEVSAHYEGSIDKRGANADWDWFLYQDKRGEWVLLDVDGPGCLYNFVQHRYPTSEEPVFRFYFDGEETPRFTIRHSEFGEKYPFVEPLATRYMGPPDGGRGPIRVVRSFVPMPFRQGCRVTSSVKLEGADKAKGEGGWGHILYHSYPEAGDLCTFDAAADIDHLLPQYKNAGCDPKAPRPFSTLCLPETRLEPGQARDILLREGPGCVSALRLRFAPFTPALLQDLWVVMQWDGEPLPAVECPLGCVFGNSLGRNPTHYLMQGIGPDGAAYLYWPLPFWQGARITLENRGSEAAHLLYAEANVCENPYMPGAAAHFRASAHYPLQRTPGADSIIAELTGHGKLVGAHITCFAEKPHVISCEGDVRIHVDGLLTPGIESDGSESYICYGWGFATPPETNPFGGYDGEPDNPWSMTRSHIADFIPFRRSLRFGIESGENNDQALRHAGAVFYYGEATAAMECCATLDLADAASREAQGYHVVGPSTETKATAFFEGDDDHIPVTGCVVEYSGQACFTLQVPAHNRGVRLRRRSLQARNLRMAAQVVVNGEPVAERLWYFADHNPHKSWLEDEFALPPRYTAGQERLEICIKPVEAPGCYWNESRYVAFALL